MVTDMAGYALTLQVCVVAAYVALSDQLFNSCTLSCCCCCCRQVGLLEPSAGTALIGSYDITKDMDAIYSLMGVCPQHDLLWETLTGACARGTPAWPVHTFPSSVSVGDLQKGLRRLSSDYVPHIDAGLSAAASCCAAAGREHLLFYGRLKGLTGQPWGEGEWWLLTAWCKGMPMINCCAVLYCLCCLWRV
jgi:hypothetical protein